MLLFRNPPSIISQRSLRTDPLSQVPQQDHYGQRHQSIEPSTYHPLKIPLSFSVPGKEAPTLLSLCREILLTRSYWPICTVMYYKVPKKQ